MKAHIVTIKYDPVLGATQTDLSCYLSENVTKVFANNKIGATVLPIKNQKIKHTAKTTKISKKRNDSNTQNESEQNNILLNQECNINKPRHYASKKSISLARAKKRKEKLTVQNMLLKSPAETETDQIDIAFENMKKLRDIKNKVNMFSKSNMQSLTK